MTFRLVRRIAAGVAGIAVLLPAVSHPADLRDFVGDLYGGDGIQLAPPRTDPDSRFDFDSASLRGLATLGSEIASGLNLVSSGGGGSSFTFDFELGVLVESTEGFGPLVAEGADTIAAQSLSLAFSYTHIDFKQFNNESLSDFPLTFPSEDVNNDGKLGPPPVGLVIELDELRTNLDLDIEQDVFALLGKYGITEFWDTELIVPIIRIRARARAETRVVCNEEDVELCKALHFFDPAIGGDAPSSSSGGTESGIGDVVLRSKYHFLRDSDLWPDLAVRGQIKLPTGDEKDLLGTGNTDFQLMLIASKTWWLFTPHLNLAYELSTGPAAFDNLRYAVGVEANADKRLTLALDVVGRFSPHADPISDHIFDIALGARVNVWRTLLLNANVLVPLNRSAGLRPNYIWTVGFQYGFGGG